eukprot:15395339-Alexandrium_andersonii.AAC.1
MMTVTARPTRAQSRSPEPSRGHSVRLFALSTGMTPWSSRVHRYGRLSGAQCGDYCDCGNG